MTIRRDVDDFKENTLHADTFDGCMVAFALACNKIQTPVYPGARFEPPALQRFIDEAPGTPGVTRPAEIPVADAGPLRVGRDATILVLPPCVAHSIPSRIKVT